MASTALKHVGFKRLLLSILLSSVLTGIKGQNKERIYLWPNEVPNEKEAKHAPKQLDNTSGNVIRITDVSNPELLVYEPKTAKSLGIGVIVCPGGGYNILAIDKEGYEIAEWLASLGYTAFVLSYRVPNNEKGALNDIQRAIRVVRTNAEKYHLHQKKIGAIGFSAGGSLCARASTNYMVESYIKIDKMDNVSSRPDFSMLIYPAYLDNGKNNSISPELNLSIDIPPFFIFGTIDDPYGNSPLVMSKALRDNNKSVELHMLPIGGHGYGLRKGNPAAETWPILAQQWMQNIINLKNN
ncbi:MAG: alpha/beta hydrolase [Flavobacteriaceae bacterium]